MSYGRTNDLEDDIFNRFELATEESYSVVADEHVSSLQRNYRFEKPDEFLDKPTENLDGTVVIDEENGKAAYIEMFETEEVTMMNIKNVGDATGVRNYLDQKEPEEITTDDLREESVEPNTVFSATPETGAVDVQEVHEPRHKETRFRGIERIRTT